MKTLFVVIFTAFIGIESFASLPPVESLFRNGSNKEIEADSTVLTFKIKEMPKAEEQSLLNETAQVNQIPLYESYFKIILNKNANERIELLQAEYNNSEMRNGSLQGLYEGKSFLKFLKFKKELNPERDLFYGLLISLLLNDSSAISSFLKKTNSDYKSNDELINKERLELYNNYKKYLQTLKDEPNMSEELTSPLDSEDEEEKKRIQELMAQPFYTETDQVQLVKEGKSFYVLAKLEKLKAKFSNKTHKLLDISYNDIRGDINIKLINYLLFNGVNEAPKNILISFPDKNFLIEVMSLRYISYKPDTFRKIKRSLRNAVPKNKVESLAERPGFLL